MDSAAPEMALLEVPPEALHLHLLEKRQGPEDTELLVDKLKALERHFDREISAKVAKNLGSLSAELRTVAQAKAIYGSPSLLLQINSLDEQVASLSGGFLESADSLQRDFTEWSALEAQIADLDRQIKLEKLLGKLGEGDGNTDFVLMGQ
jgi:hypothetical protein